ncbi:MAG: tRNA preQ1(34) S-adenosylmethionine ribosyltransferase-isomerase QueA [Chloroflexi bacterium]|nr:tRNA preQ1(34) S-adenosylmethionine ribosyltransferase-isomerase QueA [Chloroflexota bacterium]
MKTDDFDYTLPPDLIAQAPLEPRDRSRLLVLDRATGSIRHHRFYEIAEFLQAGDVLVLNDSRVIPARLFGHRSGGGKVELLLLRRIEPKVWEALVKPARRVATGSTIEIGNGTRKIMARVIAQREDGIRTIGFADESLLAETGNVPLPPYIHVPLADPERYQTVYAREEGSAAAPTAGLHFTPALLDAVKAKGIQCHFVTLHIGLDTFQPVREADPRHHVIHREYGVLGNEVAQALSRAKQEERRVICVGTTAVRIVEQAAQVSLPGLQSFAGWVGLFILPGYRFRMVDAMVTNFHLPRSTLLMLVSAFAGAGLVRQAYAEAIAAQYRFYSFGDAMLIL